MPTQLVRDKQEIMDPVAACPRHSRFAFALCGATLVHLAILTLPLAEQPRALFAQTLQVRLSVPAAPPAASAPARVPEGNAAAREKAEPAPRTDPEPVAAPAAEPSPVPAPAASAPASAHPSPVEPAAVTEGPTGDILSAAVREVRLALARHFRYPLLARRRGWQGEVVLAVRVAADGSLGNMTVLRSSGHAVLDRAALDALAQVSTLTWAPGAAFTLELPVIYRLEEG